SLLELATFEGRAIQCVQFRARSRTCRDHLTDGTSVLQLQAMDTVQPATDEIETRRIAFDRGRILAHASAELFQVVERRGEHLVRVLLRGIYAHEVIEHTTHLAEP